MDTVRIQKKKIPEDLLPYFRLKKQNRWILRNTIIWHKRNAMPSSASDRFSVDFEYLFFFVKHGKYYFEQMFEPHLTQEARPDGIIRQRKFGYQGKYSTKEDMRKWQKNEDSIHGENAYSPQGRNMRTVWQINTQPFKEAHFAVFPPELPRRCITAGCPKEGVVLDPFMGSGTTALVAKQLNRNWVGIELSEDYCKMAQRRIDNEPTPLF